MMPGLGLQRMRSKWPPTPMSGMGLAESTSRGKTIMFHYTRRRKQFIVDKQFQLRFALTGVLYVGTIAICLYLAITPLLSTLTVLLEGKASHIVEFVQRQQANSLLTYVLCSFAFSVAWFLFSLDRSHKIAGPNMKITRFLNNTRPGEFKERLGLRQGDELKSLVAALNGLLDRMQLREEEIKLRIARYSIGGDDGSGSPEDRSARAIRFILDGVDGAPGMKKERRGESEEMELVQEDVVPQ